MPPKAKAKAGGAAAVLAKAKARASGASSPGPAAGSGAAYAKSKGSAKSKAKAKAKAAAAPLSPEDLAAIHLQAAARGKLARLEGARLREKKRQHEAEMAEAIRQTELAVLRTEQRKQDVERKKQEDKRRKAKKLAEDTKKMLEAAFDGDLPSVQKLLGQGLAVDAKDVIGYTALSESAAAGNMDVARVLLEKKADPNSRGEFKRTPLWRAAYAGNVDMVPLLLEAGSDPRLHDEQGQIPQHVAAKDEIADCIGNWDLSRTDDLVEEFDSWAEDCRLEQEFKQREAMRSVDDTYEKAKQADEAAQMMLAKAKAQMRDREKMYGDKLAAGHQDAIDACASADAELQRAESAAHAARAALDKANLARLQAAEDVGVETKLPGREVAVLDLNNVLLRDLGDRIAGASQWPVVIDPGEVTAKLLHYAGCTVLSFFRPQQMEPEQLRVSLLTMIRGGGVLAVDIFSFGGGVDRALLAEPFNRVRPGLFDDICSRSLLAVPKGSRYQAFHELINKEEKKDKFRIDRFDDKHIAKFKFMLLTSSELPHKDLMETFEPLRVMPAPG